MLHAQNLVPNPSFEEKDACPCVVMDPDNFAYGGQTPNSGSGMMGFIAYDGRETTYREYVQCRLTQPLDLCRYKISFNVSLADSSTWAINGLGCHVSLQSQLSSFNNKNGWLTEDSLFYSDSVIDATDQWVNLSFIYQAKGGEEYLTIGQMLPIMEKKQLNSYPLGVFNYGYYFIDDVSVERLNPVPIDFIPDSAICQGQEVYVQKPQGYIYTTKNFNNPIRREGTYFATIVDKDSTCTLSDTAYINVDSISLDLGRDTMLCYGDSLTLDPTYSGASYQWDNGSTMAWRQIWQAGLYHIQMKNGVCSRSDSIAIGIIDTLPLFTDVDTTLCKDESIEVELPHGNYDLIWFDGDQSRTKTFRTNQQLLGVAHNLCFSDTLSVIVRAKNCDLFKLYIPNAFSPNDDGTNDVFTLSSMNPGTRIHLKIYNRWGELLLDTEDDVVEWNGQYKGNTCPMGVYLIDVIETDQSQTVTHYTGTLHLLE
jgi:gliding motility-associated-like protein